VAAIVDDEVPRRLSQFESIYQLAMEVAKRGIRLRDAVAGLSLGETVDVDAAEKKGRLLPPIDHPDPAHLFVTGTGLTHLGSAAQRDLMHRAATESGNQTDTMRMFQMGVQDGKPLAGVRGVQPEWFFKGNGNSVSASGRPLLSPSFATDAGEEPEIAGIYLIGTDGSPLRMGFCLANEFSDHVMESKNYLWLSHSKLRPVSLGPELLTGPLPQDVRGTVRILRGDVVHWQKSFFSGEANMSHTIENLESHHFKYDLFRKPGDVHVHLFGTATLSYSDGVKTKSRDVFEIEASPFRFPLRNELRRSERVPVKVSPL
jgi:hypothetical protein